MTARIDVVPSLGAAPTVSVATAIPADAEAVGLLVATEGALPDGVELTRDRLAALGFRGAVGDALVLPEAIGPTRVLVGVGERVRADTDLRAVAAAFTRAAGDLTRLALVVDELGPLLSVPASAEALVEGAVLARYRYGALKSTDTGVGPISITLVHPEASPELEVGASRGGVLAAATALARDLANTPHNHLSATRFAELATELGSDAGLEVEVFGPDELVEMRMAGLLAINAGSAEEPRLVRLTYRPESPSRTLALVGKGVMYDSGGISLKPSDAIHAQMKNDMSGAAAILASMLALRDLGCTSTVVGYLVCTDNMPSGTATALGDVITYRDGTTVEVLDTDAEGRVAIADALILAREAEVDAIVDIATLTGSAMRALGQDMSALFANDDDLADRVRKASEGSGELVWRLPLHQPYRREIDSDTADMMNCAAIGKPDAIIAALFLAHFVGPVPWAHIDMCGPAQVAVARDLRVPGCSGWGARVLAHLALGFAS